MKIDIMTLFPEFVDGILSESIIGRARRAGVLDITTHNIRDYSEDRHRRVDDTPYGGGRGMLMAAPPIYRCYEAVYGGRGYTDADRVKVLYMSPRGRIFDQKAAAEYASLDGLIILCGHYEGVDERIIEEILREASCPPVSLPTAYADCATAFSRIQNVTNASHFLTVFSNIRSTHARMSFTADVCLTF